MGALSQLIDMLFRVEALTRETTYMIALLFEFSGLVLTLIIIVYSVKLLSIELFAFTTPKGISEH